MKAVDKINEALENPLSSDYETLISIAKKRVSMPDTLTDDEKTLAIVGALYNVTYTYADDAFGDLSELEKDIASLAESLYDAKQIQNSAKDLGFSSYSDLAKKFVDESYLKAALSEDAVILPEKTKMTIAAIGGDIHQIAIWYAYDTGMFKSVNLDIEVSAQSNGPGVYGLLSNGEADLGFLGAPPMTIRTMNAEQIRA